MKLHPAEKVVIITEKVIAKNVCEIIDNCGATGYTTMRAGGKGSHNVHKSPDYASVVEDLTTIKIEIIAHDRAMAEKIMTTVTEKFFNNYSGITYLEKVEVLRAEKF